LVLNDGFYKPNHVAPILVRSTAN